MRSERYPTAPPASPRTWVIVGRNARLYQTLQTDVRARAKEVGVTVHELSHTDLAAYMHEAPDDGALIFLFSLSKRESENRAILVSLAKQSAPVIVIGSCAILSPRADAFAYSRLKRAQAMTITALSSRAPMLYGCFGSFAQPTRRGPTYVSTLADLWRAVDVVMHASGNRVQRFARVVGMHSSTVASAYRAMEALLGAKVAAACVKLFSRHMYGYSFVDAPLPEPSDDQG